MDSSRCVGYEVHGSVALITIQRSEQLNVLNAEVVEALRDAWKRYETSDERCAILSGAGERAFCAGMDLNGTTPDVAAAIPGLQEPLTKPVIAAVAGHCIGAGYVLVQQADLAVATTSATFRYPEAKLGVFGGLGSLAATRLSHKATMEMLLLGGPISADRAREIGLINAVVPEGGHLDKAFAWANAIAESAPLVVSAIKELVDQQVMDSAINKHARVQHILAKIAESQDRKLGIDAAKQKQTAVFKGK